MSKLAVIETIAHWIDVLACAVLVIGFTLIFIVSVKRVLFREPQQNNLTFFDMTRNVRLHLGQVLLLGLEILIVSDILYSVVHRTFEEVGILGITVLMRIALSFFLNMELSHLEESTYEHSPLPNTRLRETNEPDL